MDVVSEEIPRILFLISRAHISHPAELIDLVKKNPQPIFSFGLGVDSNYSLVCFVEISYFKFCCYLFFLLIELVKSYLKTFKW